jgi:hypothetical protein
VDSPNNISEEEKFGVEMIQFLQKVRDIDEPFEKALAAWREFTPSQRNTTEEVYNMFPHDDKKGEYRP